VTSPALLAIDLYRRHLSRWKGFRCAAGVLHGRGSCSDVVRAIVEREGVVGGWTAIRAQFRTCRQAAATLRAGALDDDDDGAAEPEEEEIETPLSDALDRAFDAWPAACACETAAGICSCL